MKILSRWGVSVEFGVQNVIILTMEKQHYFNIKEKQAWCCLSVRPTNGTEKTTNEKKIELLFYLPSQRSAKYNAHSFDRFAFVTHRMDRVYEKCKYTYSSSEIWDDLRTFSKLNFVTAGNINRSNERNFRVFYFRLSLARHSVEMILALTKISERDKWRGRKTREEYVCCYVNQWYKLSKQSNPHNLFSKWFRFFSIIIISQTQVMEIRTKSRCGKKQK